MKQVSRRVAVIGLDGMYYGLLRLLVEAGYMPYLKASYNKCFHAKLLSTIPPYTPPAWTSLASGVLPDKHGFWGFLRIQRNNITIMTSCDIVYPRIWEMLDFHNIKSVIINLPGTYPIDCMVLRNVTLVSDWSSPKQFIYVNNRILHSDIFYNYEWWNYIEYPDDYIYVSEVSESLIRRVRIGLGLIEKSKPDFVFWVFSEPDWIMHRFVEIHHGKGLGKVSKIFKIIDSVIKSLAEVFDLVVIVSDHGFKVYGGIVQINSILERHGLLNVHGLKSYSKIVKNFISTNLNNDSIHERKVSFPWLHNILMEVIAKNIIPLKDIREVLKRLRVIPQIDVIHSKAIAVEEYIYIKDKDSEDFISAILSSLRNIIDFRHYNEVYRKAFRRRYYPSYILMPKYFWPSGSLNWYDEVIKARIPNHYVEGIFIAFGDGVEPNTTREIERVRTVDLVPTIMAYMGLPLPHDTDGKVIENIVNIGKGVIRRFNYLARWYVARRILKLKT